MEGELVTRLPQPGSDAGKWGDLLNEFLLREHNDDGTHRSSVAPVRTVAGKTGDVSLAQADVANLSTDLAARPKSRGSWQAQTAYAVNDLVVFENTLYRCKTAHTSSNVFHSQFVSGFWEQCGQRRMAFNVRDFGAKVDGITNDTAAIQAAIDAAAATGAPGATVFVPEGFCMINATLVLKNHVWLRGAGMFSTVIKLLPSSNCHVVQNFISPNGSQPNAQYCGVLDLTLDGNKDNQNAGSWHGIFFHTNPSNSIGGDQYFDPSHLIQNVRFYKTKGDGIHLDGRSDIRVIGCRTQFPDGVGYDSTFDTQFIGCISEGAGLQGFKVTNGSVSLSGCKAFSSGQVTAASGAGFYVNAPGAVALTGCQSQNNQAQGFLVQNTKGITLSGVVADSNNMANSGFAGVEFDGATNCTAEGICIQGEQGGVQVGNQANALRLVNGADHNSINLTHSATALATVSDFLTSDSVLLDNFVMANGETVNPTGGTSFNDSEGEPIAIDNTAAADGTSIYAARRDHRHQLGGLGQLKDTNNATVLGLTAAASAVNYVNATNSAAGASPLLQSAGTSTDIGLLLRAKGSGSVQIQMPGGGNGLSVDNFGNTVGWQKVSAGGSSQPSTLSVNGSFGFGSITTATSNLTLGSHGLVFANANSAGFTITLPAISGVGGRFYFIKKIDATTNAVTITTSSGQLIDTNQTSVTLTNQNEYVLLACDNSTGWRVFSTSVVTMPLTLKSSLAMNVSTKTGAYTLTAADGVVLADSTGSAFSLTLPNATLCLGRLYTIKDWKGTSGSQNITIATTSSQTIDGASNKVLSVAYQSLTVVSDGANWNVVQ